MAWIITFKVGSIVIYFPYAYPIVDIVSHLVSLISFAGVV
jgi:hypothetical protein